MGPPKNLRQATMLWCQHYVSQAAIRRVICDLRLGVTQVKVAETICFSALNIFGRRHKHNASGVLIRFGLTNTVDPELDCVRAAQPRIHCATHYRFRMTAVIGLRWSCLDDLEYGQKG